MSTTGRVRLLSAAPTRKFVRAFILVLTAVLVTACSGQAASVAPTPTSGAPTIAPTTAPTKTPTPTPAHPAPAALQGRWRAEVGAGIAILTFTATKYAINWLGAGAGLIAVEGDEITFSGSSGCPGNGTYRWSIDGDELHFEPVGTDACPIRADWAGNRTYKRYD